MPIRIPTQSLRLERGVETKKMLIAGQFIDRKVPKIVMPKVGQPFDFKKEEIDWLAEHAPTALRMPVNESPAAAPEGEGGESGANDL